MASFLLSHWSASAPGAPCDHQFTKNYQKKWAKSTNGPEWSNEAIEAFKVNCRQRFRMKRKGATNFVVVCSEAK